MVTCPPPCPLPPSPSPPPPVSWWSPPAHRRHGAFGLRHFLSSSQPPVLVMVASRRPSHQQLGTHLRPSMSDTTLRLQDLPHHPAVIDPPPHPPVMKPRGDSRGRTGFCSITVSLTSSSAGGDRIRAVCRRIRLPRSWLVLDHRQ
jgi:hypothetical protein